MYNAVDWALMEEFKFVIWKITSLKTEICNY